jgi:catechol 2,3-dioxygenase-like lactoylglutathione lyase family enzyme
MPHAMTATQEATIVGGALRAIVSFHLVTPDLSRLVAFYHEVLGFALEGAPQSISGAEMARLGVAGGAIRQVLSIGQQRVAIEQFEIAGRPYPSCGDAASLWFQHLALVVTDIAAAHARLRGAAPISRRGPQKLPPAFGGVKAFKFRDPDGHPLELLEFPVGQSPAIWRERSVLPGQIALGIDHTAISVGDVATSKMFYGQLGLAPEPGTLNQGLAQRDLDDLQDVRVAVAPMRPQAIGTPHLELLGYEVPRGEIGPALRPNDVAATRIAWSGAGPSLLDDPDGHLHQVVS